MKDYTFFININSFPIYQESIVSESFTEEDLKSLYLEYLPRLERIVRYFCVSRGLELISLLNVKNVAFTIHDVTNIGTVNINLPYHLDRILLNELAKVASKQLSK